MKTIRLGWDYKSSIDFAFEKSRQKNRESMFEVLALIDSIVKKQFFNLYIGSKCYNAFGFQVVFYYKGVRHAITNIADINAFIHSISNN